MPDSTLDQLVRVQKTLEISEADRDKLLAQRDELLLRTWQERIPERVVAETLGLSSTRTGNLRRRARGLASVT